MLDFIVMQMSRVISIQFVLSVLAFSCTHLSSKKVLEILYQTTMVVMIDDPQISSTLGEFPNQIQGGLIQGSASSGLYAPIGSVLLSSDDMEVPRY